MESNSSNVMNVMYNVRSDLERLNIEVLKVALSTYYPDELNMVYSLPGHPGVFRLASWVLEHWYMPAPPKDQLYLDWREAVVDRLNQITPPSTIDVLRRAALVIKLQEDIKRSPHV